MSSYEASKPQTTLPDEQKKPKGESNMSLKEKRLNLMPVVEGFVYSHPRFKDLDVQITFTEMGISSLVSVLETQNEKVVLKIPLNNNYASDEGKFFEVWKGAGVQVPHVIETGVIAGNQYTLMEHIDSPVLVDKYSPDEMVENNIHYQMGETLKNMHSPSTEGYGHAKDGNAEFSKFSEWLEGDYVKDRVDYVNEHNLLTEMHGTSHQVKEILSRHVQNNPESSYCHDDFNTHNIFATTPITVFDPNPRFNNNYIDLGRSLMIQIAHGMSKEAGKQFIDGYFGEEPYDERVLHASVVLTCYMKLRFWHKTKSKRKEMIERVESYLVENKHLLD